VELKIQHTKSRTEARFHKGGFGQTGAKLYAITAKLYAITANHIKQAVLGFTQTTANFNCMYA